MANQIFDVLILGAGPAGLAAALALARQLRTVAIFSTNQHRNHLSKHMHMIPTWDHKDASDFRAATRAEILSRYSTVQFADIGISALKKLSDSHFEATDSVGTVWNGRKVLLAHGVTDTMPEDVLPGYTECWARGIFHCLFCHGYEERGAPSTGVLAFGMVSPAHAVSVARMARNLAGSVTIYANGDEDVAGQICAAKPGPRIEVDTRKIARVEMKYAPGQAPLGRHSDIVLHFEEGGSKTEGFVAHMPTPKLSAPFAVQLGSELLPSGMLKVGAPFPETSVKGVFAAGDIATPAPAVAAAIGSGQFAGVGIVQQLAGEVTE